MNICVIISSHSPSIYTKLTISTLLRAVQNNHNLNIHIGVHSNYSDYTSDLSLFKDLKGQTATICGGSMEECLLDLEITAKSMGVNINRDYRYIYSASHCPIKWYLKLNT